MVLVTPLVAFGVQFLPQLVIARFLFFKAVFLSAGFCGGYVAGLVECQGGGKLKSECGE
jgi:hypothetical protein